MKKLSDFAILISCIILTAIAANTLYKISTDYITECDQIIAEETAECQHSGCDNLQVYCVRDRKLNKTFIEAKCNQ
jgi:hypothetical protein